MAVSERRVGLRERKKQRTREAIVRAATQLFVERGYEATTLAEIASGSDVALSTLFNYFPTKADLVFSVWDAVTESARRRILERGEGESAAEAIVSWIVEELPEVESPYAELVRDFPKIVDSNPELQAQGRLRHALLEDVLAAAFARDLGESEESLRVRVLAAIALRGMVDVWRSWYEKHASDSHFDLGPVFALKAEYVERALEAGHAAVELLPRHE